MLEIGERPWGKYFVLQDEPNFKLKRIEVLPNQRLSYQYHHHRQEFWTIVEGEAIELAKKFANPDADHLEDPSAEDSELHLERCARLKEGDDAAVDFGSDEPHV